MAAVFAEAVDDKDFYFEGLVSEDIRKTAGEEKKEDTLA